VEFAPAVLKALVKGLQNLKISLADILTKNHKSNILAVYFVIFHPKRE